MKRSAAIAGISAVLVAGLAGVLPALAADDGTVNVVGNTFSPRNIAVKPGEKVTFVNTTGIRHSLKFDDELAARADGTSWSRDRTFAAASDTPYRYVCTWHAPGMSGNVYVNETGTLPPSETPSPSPTGTPTATPTATATTPPPSGGGGGGGGGGGTAPPELRSLELAGSSFCARKCDRPGVRLAIDLSAPAEVTGKLKRKKAGKFRKFGRLDFGVVAAGPQELAFKKVESGKRLKRGRYKLKLTAAGETRTLKFKLRR